MNRLANLLARTQVTVQRGDDPAQRLRGFLLGRVERMVLLHLPEAAALVRGERVIVRTVQAGRALGFDTTVEHVATEPAPLCYLAEPGQVEEISLRKAERLEVFVPADLRYAEKKGDDADTLIVKGNMLDISEGGCRVYTKRPVPAETVTHVSFTLPGERHLCTVSGVVLDQFAVQSVFGQRIKFFASEQNLADLGEIRRWIKQNREFADLS